MMGAVRLTLRLMTNTPGLSQSPIDLIGRMRGRHGMLVVCKDVAETVFRPQCSAAFKLLATALLVGDVRYFASYRGSLFSSAKLQRLLSALNFSGERRISQKLLSVYYQEMY